MTTLNKLREVFEAIAFYRGLILDIAEQELGDKPNWQYVRGRLLKALGNRGLQKRLEEILDSSQTTEISIHQSIRSRSNLLESE
jgi:hypothetical protein